MIILQIVAASLVLWLMFIAFANSKPHLEHGHAPPIHALLLLYSFIFGVVDVALNLTYGTLTFLDIPREWTLTARMKRLLATDLGWRARLADFVCRRMVEPWDWNHCGLAETKKWDRSKW